MIKLVIFDLDGTLIDSTTQIILAVNRTRNQLRMSSAGHKFLTSQIGLSAKELFSDLELTEVEVDQAVEIFRGHLRDITLRREDVFDAVPEMLNFLKSRGNLLAIATNKPSDLAKIALEDSGLLKHIDFIAGSESLPHKPDPALVSSCLQNFNLNPTQAVMIGDRCEDMIAARCAKVAGFAVLQGFHTEVQLMESGARQVFLSIGKMFEKLSEGWIFENL
jgi:phosphoglycolate phosphatase